VNGADGTSTGVEIAPDWRPVAWWQLDGSYGYQRFDVDMHTATVDGTARYERSSPRHQLHLRSALTLPARLELDLLYRYVSKIPARVADGYHTADVRVGWTGPGGLDIAVLGRNLLEPGHVEFGTDPATAVSVSRSAAVTVTWRSRTESTP
jgi:iron complex outermembrane receptor protein